MKKRGFTLIELLAVIVILAIIALIATPIVMNVIEGTKKGAAERSAENYLRAVETAIASERLDGSITDGTYKVDENGDLVQEKNGVTIKIEVKVSGTVPLTETTIVIVNGQIDETKVVIVFENYTVKQNDDGKLEATEKVDSETPTPAICSLISGDGTNPGDEIECAGEHFNVIKNDGTNIEMLAKFNLNVGTKLYPNEATYGIQEENAKGRTYDGTEYYAVTKFCDSRYWLENYVIKDKYKDYFIYDENSVLYDYLEAYKDYLLGKGVTDASATLLSLQQAKDLGCNTTGGCTNPDYSWVNSTQYWIGTATTGTDLRYVYPGGLGSGNYTADAGVRPVIIIPANLIG